MPKKIVVENANKVWDEEKEQFIYLKNTTFTIEHSLISISKWESKWHKPYMSRKDKTYEENIDYIKCMTLEKEIDENIYKHLSKKNMEDIQSYIDDPMSASKILSNKAKNASKSNNQSMTSEYIYYSMIALEIPVEFEKWHINRLLTLIEICSEKNKEAYGDTKNKMSKSQLAARNSKLNAARKAKFNSKG